jgi:DNA-binding response OmpR family regulator
MSREDLIEEVEALRAVLYGSPVDIEINTLRERLRITPHEARVLLCLNRAPNRFVPRWVIEEDLPPKWGNRERSTKTNNVDVYLSHLRSRLGRAVIERQGDGWHMCGYRLTEAGRQAVAAALG